MGRRTFAIFKSRLTAKIRTRSLCPRGLSAMRMGPLGFTPEGCAEKRRGARRKVLDPWTDPSDS